MTPKLIQRPKRYTRGYRDPDTVAALLRTLGTEHAVVIEVPPGDHVYNLYNRYRSAVAAQGYRFHGRRGKHGELMAWITPGKGRG
jgi:hypothetical protein